jgi:hypothetical protein
LTFARFEYALKSAQFARLDMDRAEPDWVKFINEVDKDDPLLLAPVLASGKYLLTDPPRQQIRTDGGLAWEEVKRQPGSSELRFLLEGVKRVRNNLFHGGKFETLTDLSERNSRLVRDSLDVLRGVLMLPRATAVREAFFRYALEEA